VEKDPSVLAPETAPCEAASPFSPWSAGRRSAKTRRIARRWLRRIALAALAAAVAYHAWIFAHVWRLRDHDPATTAFMEQGLARLRERDPGARLRHRWVPYRSISVHLKRAVLAAEDQKFLQHAGFDFEEMEKALAKNRRRGRSVRGASTISQQLAKNLFLSARRSYVRKAQEAAMTLMIEGALGKRRILELYLNVIEWGDGVYGAEAAAVHYYGTSAAELTAEEAARLAAMIPNPRFYERRPASPYLEERAWFLLEQMDLVPIP
jgi:monofunctional biosynthetic peptidoglycan transglycosylase